MRDDLVRQLWTLLGGAAGECDRLTVTGPTATLSSRFPVTDAGAAAVGAALLAATADPDGGVGRPVGLDTRQLAVALTSERHLLHDGVSPGNPFDPLSTFHRTADGWLRLHANYPWHRAAARRVLDLPDDAGPGDVAAAARHWRSEELETAVHEGGGVAAAVRTEKEWQATPAGAAAAGLPLVGRHDLADAPPRPRRARTRVLDLTRVIAGPVATRTLAAHGAEVLRIDPPDRPELRTQTWEALPGKHSAVLDLATNPERLEALLAGADVVVSGYRPHALDRFGLAPEALAARFPGLVVVTLSAWGDEGPWAGRRGFDSLVQAACGIGETERRDPDPATPPGVLPAQVLDHATGYLGAAAALLALARQRRVGGTPHVRLALAATATWLQSLPRPDDTDGGTEPVDARPWLEQVEAPDGVLTLASPPGTVDGTRLHWPSPAPAYGAAAATWPSDADPS
ncbi:CoA transferase [Pseudonocardia benzenivorans]|uniref:L-carnitine dehydratase/bile acid-inducible protein F n=2 Tax=Pseudonocardia TaxID=1847 RepID=F4D0F5_PSEUX|nr:CoA transferase [Pseudonocardia dioxanivorans]AEA26751.1 L-carnitine dehydratase/bile acid-inducible protein F [Pseudonocardia dioxanivorans CB1190]